MKIVIAPSGSGKTHLLKGLTRMAGCKNPSGWSASVSWHGRAAELWDGDTIPAIAGVYKAMERFKTDEPWWDNPEHGPALATLMRRAFGQIALDSRYREGIVLTAEVTPLFMMPSACIVVVPPVSLLVAHTNKRHTGQPVFTPAKAEKVHFWYKTCAAMAGVPTFSLINDALIALKVESVPTVDLPRTSNIEVVK
uniref:Uncharacterized protein n=1 Tax=viral metagenome TaxID=1070528 RepID=A0A2V0RIB5_9ZZZZ